MSLTINSPELRGNLQAKILPRRKLYAVEVRAPFGQPLVTDHLQAIITVLSLVNPFMCAAIFVQIEAGKSPGSQLGSATKVALAVLVILTVAALVGVKVLHLFGVSLDAFMVAGGGVLAWLRFSMLRGPSRRGLPQPPSPKPIRP
jgi:multiple antibiotic resistance protein